MPEEKPSFSDLLTKDRIQDMLDYCGSLNHTSILSTWDDVVASAPKYKESFDAIKPIYDTCMEFSCHSIKTDDFESVFSLSLAISTLCHHKLIRQTYSVYVDGKILDKRWDSITGLCETLDVKTLDEKKAEIVIFYRRKDYEKQLPPTITDTLKSKIRMWFRQQWYKLKRRIWKKA